MEDLYNSINEGFEKIFKKLDKLEEAIYLGNDNPYMLRDDEEILDIRKAKLPLRDHPYIIDDPKGIPSRELGKLLFNRLKDLKWFYDYSKNSETKELIEKFLSAIYNNISALKSNNETENQFKEYIENIMGFQINSDNISELGDIYNMQSKLNILTNQEFCRFRTMNDIMGKNIYFRISSKDKDWFDLIYGVIYNNRPVLNKVIITRDEKVDGDFSSYDLDNINTTYMDVDDFIYCRRKPVLESSNQNLLPKLNNGGILPQIFPNYTKEELDKIQLKLNNQKKTKL